MLNTSTSVASCLLVSSALYIQWLSDHSRTHCYQTCVFTRNPNTILLWSPTACNSFCKATLDVYLAHLRTARLQRALTHRPCVPIALTWESGSCRSACSLCFCQTADSVLSHMSVKEVSVRGKAPGVSSEGT